ncbi:2OG-Fe(II) oxygenase [Xylariaceae sp. FL1019]|nr:2OG-Fe(II) oxygenase [Xylariaceae sp. FL1019]
MADKAANFPLVDISGYLNPTSPEDKAKVIAQVRDAFKTVGFFQCVGHGVPVDLQRAMFKASERFYRQPKEKKMEISVFNSKCRRGYEASGAHSRDGKAIPDAKESLYFCEDDPEVEMGGIYGPNQWPDLPEDEFRKPMQEYYKKTSAMGRMLWEMLIEGLDRPTSTMERFSKRPLIGMNLLRYPAPEETAEGQFGLGAHNDWGGITVLLQEPGKEALEIWVEDDKEWVSVPAVEDRFVINCGDMLAGWSGNVYRSVHHRVVNKAAVERYSTVTAWHGDIFATNPFEEPGKSKETVGHLFVKRFQKQLKPSPALLRAIGVEA